MEIFTILYLILMLLLISGGVTAVAAAGLLFGCGARMVWQALRHRGEDDDDIDEQLAIADAVADNPNHSFWTHLEDELENELGKEVE
jgi:hypothetical protein